MEILFEQDNEEKSVASLILDALVKVSSHYSFVEIICKILKSRSEKNLLEMFTLWSVLPLSNLWKHNFTLITVIYLRNVSLS